MNIKATLIRAIYQVQFPPNVDHKKIAKILGLNKQTVWGWIKTGIVPGKYIDPLKKIPIKDVITEGSCSSSRSSSSTPSTGSPASE